MNKQESENIKGLMTMLLEIGFTIGENKVKIGDVEYVPAEEIIKILDKYAK